MMKRMNESKHANMKLSSWRRPHLIALSFLPSHITSQSTNQPKTMINPPWWKNFILIPIHGRRHDDIVLGNGPKKYGMLPVPILLGNFCGMMSNEIHWGNLDLLSKKMMDGWMILEILKNGISTTSLIEYTELTLTCLISGGWWRRTPNIPQPWCAS